MPFVEILVIFGAPHAYRFTVHRVQAVGSGFTRFTNGTQQACYDASLRLRWRSFTARSQKAEAAWPSAWGGHELNTHEAR